MQGEGLKDTIQTFPENDIAVIDNEDTFNVNKINVLFHFKLASSTDTLLLPYSDRIQANIVALLQVIAHV